MKFIPGSDGHVISDGCGELYVGDSLFYNLEFYEITKIGINGLGAFCEDTDDEIFLTPTEVDALKI